MSSSHHTYLYNKNAESSSRVPVNTYNSHHTHTYTHKRQRKIWIKTEEEEIRRILSGEPIKELPDKAKIKWSKTRVKRVGKRIVLVRKPHPGTEDARKILEQTCRSLTVCEECESTIGPMIIHHVDGNPYNNDLPNLQVLCLNCHLNHHGPADTQGIQSWDIDIPNEDSDIKADVEVEKDTFSEKPIPAPIHQSQTSTREPQIESTFT